MARTASPLAAARTRARELRDGTFVRLLQVHGVPTPVREHQFDPQRKWRFDFAWPGLKLALEVEGGVWTRGRHTRGAGAVGDMEKYNAAALNGWRLIRITPAMMDDLTTVALLKRVITQQPRNAND